MIWAAFIFGFMGSTHCIGMCGPIALTLPLERSEKWLVFRAALIYNVGRISAYGFMGLLLGIIGTYITMVGFQKGFSVGAGILLLLAAIFSINIEQRLLQLPLLRHFYGQIQKSIGKALRKSGVYQPYWIGFLNGFLPCGLVYLALAGAISSGKIWDGFLFMVAFGLGTLPLMFGIAASGRLISPGIRQRIRNWSPAIMILFSVFLIMRGMNIQPPIELKFWQDLNHPIMCH